MLYITRAAVLVASITTGALAARAAATQQCLDREHSCSGHGDCSHPAALEDGTARTCVCDRFYEGERCDVWRAPQTPPPGFVGVRWLNCTHGQPANGTVINQHCDMLNKSICEAAGAPTVPPPAWQGVCYQAPRTPPPGAKSPSVCSDYRGIGVVIHGVKGAFCARPCATADELTCDNCPCHPEGGNPCPCKIMNKSTGKCAYCAGECKHEHGSGVPEPSSSAPCSPGDPPL